MDLNRTANPPPPADLAEALATFKQLIETNTTHEHGSTSVAEGRSSRRMNCSALANSLSFRPAGSAPRFCRR